MRIASLLPSATEIVYAIGLGDDVVAVTHECDFPDGASSKTRVTRSLLAPELPSAEIDRAVVESTQDAHSIYELDIETLVRLRPDLIITQDLCEVCAVPRSAVDEAVALLRPAARVLSLDPNTLDEVLESIALVGEASGRASQAQRTVDTLRQRIVAVQRAVESTTSRPRVFCCEWLDPIFCGGHWVPELVGLAGGIDGVGIAAQPSFRIEWDAVLAYQPEVVVLMPCGFDAAQAAERIDELSRRPGWSDLPAVCDSRVFAVNASAYFSRPGPRLVDGLELLARILHPDAFAKPAPEGAILRLAGPPASFEPYS
ncbi:MAG: cobalamin-binding protein [Dehalococcoidia bacterium]